MASLTKSHPSPSVDLTLLEICLPFRPFFIAGNPSVLPPDLHCRKSVIPSARSSLPEIRLIFRSFFIAGNPSALLLILHCWKSVCSSVHSLLPEICLPFRPFFIAGNPSALPPDLPYRKSVRPSARSSLPEIRLPFRPFFITGRLPLLTVTERTPGSVSNSRLISFTSCLPLMPPTVKQAFALVICHHPGVSMGESSRSIPIEGLFGCGERQVFPLTSQMGAKENTGGPHSLSVQF